MKSGKLLVLAMLATFLIVTSLTGCGVICQATGLGDPGVAITPSMAYTLIQENEGNSDFVIMDVRTPEEYSNEHIAGSILLDFNADDFEAGLDKLDKNKTFLLYCRSGNRSGKAADIMSELAFTDVYDIDGGINQWKAEGYPTVK